MQTPPETPASPQEGRSGGPKRRRRNSTSSDASEDGAVFLGRRPRSISPEPDTWGIFTERRPQSQRNSRRNSNVSEDGAVFMGRNISRANTPRPRARRRALSINVPTSGGEVSPRSPMGRLVYRLEGNWNWTENQKRKFWKQAALALTVVLSFMIVTGFNSPDCPPRFTSDGGDAVCIPTHQSPSASSSRYPTMAVNWHNRPTTTAPGSSVLEGSPTPSSPIGPLSPTSPNSPTFPDSSTPNPGPTGVLASQLWTFNPKVVAYAFSEYLLGSIGKMVNGALWSQVGNQVTKRGSEVFAAEPDIHGWDVVVASQRNRASILSASRNVEEVSWSLKVQLSDQLFANQSADASDNAERITTLQALQTQLDELKVHQYEIVK
jgi:hypothetical protein